MAKLTQHGTHRDTQRQKLYSFERPHIYRHFPTTVRTKKFKKPRPLTIINPPGADYPKYLGTGEYVVSLHEEREDGTKVYRGVQTSETVAVPMTLPECQAVVDWCLAHFGIDPTRYKTKVGPGKRHRRAVAYGSHRIELPLWARNIPVAIHEASHAIVDRTGGYEAWHGPEFCRVFFHLIGKTKVLSEADLVKQAREYGLKVAPSTYIKEAKARLKRYN
jgi:hypothetical protein